MRFLMRMSVHFHGMFLPYNCFSADISDLCKYNGKTMHHSAYYFLIQVSSCLYRNVCRGSSKTWSFLLWKLLIWRPEEAAEFPQYQTIRCKGILVHCSVECVLKSLFVIKMPGFPWTESGMHILRISWHLSSKLFLLDSSWHAHLPFFFLMFLVLIDL